MQTNINIINTNIRSKNSCVYFKDLYYNNIDNCLKSKLLFFYSKGIN